MDAVRCSVRSLDVVSGIVPTELLSWRQTIDKVGQLYRSSDAGFRALAHVR